MNDSDKEPLSSVEIPVSFLQIFLFYVFKKIATFVIENISIMNFLDSHIYQIKDLCRKYKVRRLFAFGSVLTDKFNEQSDVDLIVDFDKNAIKDYFLNYFDFKYALENVLGRQVDLLEEQPIRNSYLKKNIESTKTLISG